MIIQCPYCHRIKEVPGDKSKKEYRICVKCLKEQYAEGDK